MISSVNRHIIYVFLARSVSMHHVSSRFSGLFLGIGGDIIRFRAVVRDS